MERLSPKALQKLMRHKSFTTTGRYINMVDSLNEEAENLHVPDVLGKKKTG